MNNQKGRKDYWMISFMNQADGMLYQKPPCVFCDFEDNDLEY